MKNTRKMQKWMSSVATDGGRITYKGTIIFHVNILLSCFCDLFVKQLSSVYNKGHSI